MFNKIFCNIMPIVSEWATLRGDRETVASVDSEII